MDFSDFFKSFFGFRSCNRCQPDENVPHVYVVYDEDQDGNGHPNFQAGFGNMFQHFHGNMFQQMEELSRHMEDMFHNSGHMELPPGFMEGEQQQRPSENPRDLMLKEPDSYTESSSQQPSRVIQPQDQGFFRSPSFFGRFPSPRSSRPDFEDLVESRKGDSFVDFFNNPNESSPPSENSPAFNRSPFRSFTWSGSSSFSSQTISGTDGKIEQRRTVRDSSGNEETTITRSIGDQTHSVTVKKDKTGATEKIENFQNMDQDDLSKFEGKWRIKKHQAIEDNPGDRMMIPGPTKPDRGGNESFWKKLFGL